MPAFAAPSIPGWSGRLWPRFLVRCVESPAEQAIGLRPRGAYAPAGSIALPFAAGNLFQNFVLHLFHPASIRFGSIIKSMQMQEAVNDIQLGFTQD
jgi:hypothetical protein